MTNAVVQKLLGPEGRPLSCEECFIELDRYVERRLAGPAVSFERCAACNQSEDCERAGECLGMAVHLESCPACDEEYASLRGLVLAEQRGQPWTPEKAR
jgi:hypothetical protein